MSGYRFYWFSDDYDMARRYVATFPVVQVGETTRVRGMRVNVPFTDCFGRTDFDKPWHREHMVEVEDP